MNVKDKLMLFNCLDCNKSCEKINKIQPKGLITSRDFWREALTNFY